MGWKGSPEIIQPNPCQSRATRTQPAGLWSHGLSRAEQRGWRICPALLATLLLSQLLLPSKRLPGTLLPYWNCTLELPSSAGPLPAACPAVLPGTAPSAPGWLPSAITWGPCLSSAEPKQAWEPAGFVLALGGWHRVGSASSLNSSAGCRRGPSVEKPPQQSAGRDTGDQGLSPRQPLAWALS